MQPCRPEPQPSELESRNAGSSCTAQRSVQLLDALCSEGSRCCCVKRDAEDSGAQQHPPTELPIRRAATAFHSLQSSLTKMMCGFWLLLGSTCKSECAKDKAHVLVVWPELPLQNLETCLQEIPHLLEVASNSTSLCELSSSCSRRFVACTEVLFLNEEAPFQQGTFLGRIAKLPRRNGQVRQCL